MRLRGHLLRLVLVVLVPMIVFATMVVVAFGRHQRATVERGAIETARALMSAVDEHLAASIATLEAVATLPSVERGDLRQFHADAVRVLRSQPTWITIILIGPDGRQLVNALRPPGSSLPGVPDRSSFEAVLATRRPVIGDVAFGPITQQHDFAVRVPVIRGGSVAYVLTAVVKPAALVDVLARQRVPADWVATVFDRNKRIVARSKNLDRFLGGSVSPDFATLLDAGGSEGWAVTHTLEGVAVDTAFIRSARSGWGLGFGLQAAAVAAPLRRSTLVIVGGGLAFLVVAVLLAVAGGRRITAPIASLAAAARAFGERGDLPTTAPAGVAEIEDVREAFAGAAALVQRRAEQLAESEEWLRVTIGSIGDAVIATDAGGRVALLNPRAEALTGWTAGEAVGRPLEDVFVIVNEETRRPAANPVRRALREGVITGLANHTVLIARDGREIPIDDSAAPIRRGDRLVGAVMVFRDVSGRRVAERERAALLETERAARADAEAATARLAHVLAVTDTALSGAEAESLMRALLIRLRAALKADTATVLLLEPDGSHLTPLYSDGLREEIRESIHVPVGRGIAGRIAVSDDGLVFDDLAAFDVVSPFLRKRVKSLVGAPLRVGSRLIGVIHAGAITPRRFGEDDLRLLRLVAERVALAVERTRLHEAERAALAAAEAAERRASFLAEVSRLLAASLDYEVTLERIARLAVPEMCDLCVINLLEEDGRIRRAAVASVDPANERVVRDLDRQFPIHRESAHPVAKVLRTGRPDFAAEISADVLATIAPQPEYRHIAHALDYRSYVVAPLIARGRTLGTLSFVAGPSGRRYGPDDVALAEELAHRAGLAVDNAALYREAEAKRAAAEAANRAKDEFLTTLSHELRTPLNAVYGWARMLRAGQVSEDRIERALDAIIRNADAQVQLVDDLLDISRVVTGKMRLDVRPVDLRAVVDAALDAVRPAAAAKTIRLESVLDPRAGPITGDPDRLQQVVWNLLMNAVKFTPKGGRIQVHLQRVNSHVEIVVSDTGQGIAPTVLPFVFDRFRQADSSTTRAHAGLGLGLALVKHLAELHGGSVSAHSAGEDKGATFVVKLPLSIADIPETWPTRRHPTAGSLASPIATARLDGLRVLIVDDDADALELAAAILTRAGATTRTCNSAAAALEILPHWHPDVLVSDIEMPGEDGYALIRKVRALDADAGGKTPAIALTAYGRPLDRSLSLSAGYSMHVPKPVDPGELTTIIASVAGRPIEATRG